MIDELLNTGRVYTTVVFLITNTFVSVSAFGFLQG